MPWTILKFPASSKQVNSFITTYLKNCDDYLRQKYPFIAKLKIKSWIFQFFYKSIPHSSLLRWNQLYVSRETNVNIVDSRRSCDDLWLSSQERQFNDDRYTIWQCQHWPLHYLTKSTLTWSTFVDLAMKKISINILQIRYVATILL